MEHKNPPTPHNKVEQIHAPLTPEGVRRNFEDKRIVPNPDLFAPLYSTYKDDMARTARIGEVFDNQLEKDDMGPLGEALVFKCIEDGALGTHITARGTSKYDDFFHGSDIVIEHNRRQHGDPIVSSIDVTLSQTALGRNPLSKFESDGVVNEVGLEKKLERVKRHIQEIARYPRERAVDMSAWLQSGGLSQSRTDANRGKFDEAERLMLIKYYENPSTAEDPNKPHFVLAGPQVVVSIDSSFVNKTFHGNQQEKALKDVSTLIQAEVPFAVAMINNYIEAMAKDLTRRNQTPNLFFDTMRASCRAWSLTFESEQNQMRLEKAINDCLKDPELRKQIAYYQNTLNKAFMSGR